MANDREREEIRNGFDALTFDSARPLRECLIAQVNGYSVPAESIAKLIAIEEQAHALRCRNAVLNGRTPPDRPEWLDPASPDESDNS